MKSLRFSLVLPLIVAIVTVVGLAAFAASRVLQPPLPEATMEPVTRRLHLMVELAERNRQEAVALGAKPAGLVQTVRLPLAQGEKHP